MARPKLWVLPLLATLLATATIGQRGGGKAEPLRIEFKRGASSAILNDTIRGSEEAEYVFAARQGQRVNLTLTSTPARSARFELKSADGVDYKFEYNGTRWAGVVPVSGDYFINVTRVSQKPGHANYSLKLAIK